MNTELFQTMSCLKIASKAAQPQNRLVTEHFSEKKPTKKLRANREQIDSYTQEFMKTDSKVNS